MTAPEPDPQLLLDWLVDALGYPFNGPIRTAPDFPVPWRRRLAEVWHERDGASDETVDDYLATCAEEGGWRDQPT